MVVCVRGGGGGGGAWSGGRGSGEERGEVGCAVVSLPCFRWSFRLCPDNPFRHNQSMSACRVPLHALSMAIERDSGGVQRGQSQTSPARWSSPPVSLPPPSSPPGRRQRAVRGQTVSLVRFGPRACSEALTAHGKGSLGRGQCLQQLVGSRTMLQKLHMQRPKQMRR